MRRVSSVLVLLVCALAGTCLAQAQSLQKGDYVAVVGDSITEQRKYSVFIEDYLIMCQPAAELRQTQFGWSGETSWGFEARMNNDMLRFKPTCATTCFGMNDGGYSPMNEQKAQRYRDAQTKIVEKMKSAGVRFIVVGSPGCVDVQTFRNHNRQMAEMYNKTLASLRDIAKDVAEKEGVAFADVFGPMHDVMEKAEAKYGPKYSVCGGDGVHPDNNGHLVMAYAFLKGLGCKGDIGTITVDLGASKAEATEGHKVLSMSNGQVEIESTRYPFCFYGEEQRTDSTRGVLEFLPFNQDLNRLMLVVNNAGSGKVKVTWGSASKEFDTAELQKGINLAAEFLDNPFSQPFARLQQEIQRKEELETPLVKQTINEIPHVSRWAEADKDPLERAADAGFQCDKDLQAALTVSVVPVRHTIRIEPVK
ncbi:MAG TPA: SGNH/GDSL hydrolase family protein [Tepidisphaeraceae bacterium]|nr:SGNH/GDSL hydrolase family protein [Tepidisphaeraceae bacterium]